MHMKLKDLFSSIEDFDVWLLSLKPGYHARISNAGKLVIKPYKFRKIQLGNRRFIVVRR